MTIGVEIGTRPPAAPESLIALREQLNNMRALLVLSILMTESADADQILRLAASSASSLGTWRVAGFILGDTWHTGTDCGRRLAGELGGHRRVLPDSGGPVVVDGPDWVWAYPLRSIAGPLGHMVTYAEREPALHEQFLAQVLAQQTGVALSNARLHARERDTATALADTNRALEDTVATLQRGMQIHERLTAVATAGEGATGIAHALHELTGLSVAVEDRYGNLQAWAGPNRPEPYPELSAYDRDRLLRKLMEQRRSARDGDRVVALASPRADVLGVIALIDPERTAGTTDLVALEHSATVLAVELARLRGLADTELRVRRELVHDLLTGTDDESARLRADALRYNLGPPQRVVVIECCERSRPQDDLAHAVRRALRELHVVGLVGSLGATVVVVTGDEADWEALRRTTVAELGGGHCRLAVGDPYPRPGMLPSSLREARLALRLQNATSPTPKTSIFHDLDVFRMLAAVDDLGDVERFARTWLGELVRYDSRHGTALVKTLTQYLQHGGAYEATSRALSVHRSTLRYRVQRIRELTHLDLTDPETRFNLELATRAWVTLQALRD